MVSKRTPGIVFETRTPEIDQALPRMDIAAFAGFAASGPIGVPVAIEDVDRFQEIFGADLALAWDRQQSRRRYAFLGPAVRAFLRNGGERCWVLRLADPVTAITHRFRLPGVLEAADGALAAALAEARSPGAWARSLRVNASVQATPIRCQRDPAAAAAVQVAGVGDGDLLRIELSGSADVCFIAVPPRPVEAEGGREPLRSIDLSQGLWFRRQSAAGPAAEAPLWLGAPAAVQVLAGPADAVTALPFHRWGVSGDRFVLELDAGDAAALAPGVWLRLNAALVDPASAETATVLLLVDDLALFTDAAASPPGAETVRITSRRAWSPLDPAAALAATATLTLVAAVMTLELWVTGEPQGRPDAVAAGATSLRRLPGLGLTPDHPRFWGDAPGDAALFAARIRPLPLPGVNALIDRPRFPLAATPRPDSRPAPWLIPLGVTASPSDADAQPAVAPGSGPRLADEGLGRFAADLFIDPALAGTGVEAVIAEAQALGGDAAATAIAPATPLRPGGLHALLPVDEICMVAVPDLVHPAWQKTVRVDAAAPLAAPGPLTATSGPGAATATLLWPAVAGATRYEVETADQPGFASPRPVAVVIADPAAAMLSADHAVAIGDGCPRRLFYRVRAVAADGRTSPWSKAAWLTLPAETFARRDDDLLPAPVLALSRDDARLTLSWSGDGDAFLLEMTTDPAFLVAEVVYDGPDRQFQTWSPSLLAAGATADQRYLVFRVRALTDAGQASPWSETAVAGETVGEDFESDPPDAFNAGVLLSVQRDLLRLCAARGDLHALLSLPEHFEAAETAEYAGLLAAPFIDGATAATRHLGAINPPPAPFGDIDARTLSFGSLHHPWLRIGDDAGEGVRSPTPTLPVTAATRLIPGEGALAGVLAARTIAGGAWLSPVNRPIAGAISAEPRLAGFPTAYGALGVNRFMQQPPGVVATAAVTLSPDDVVGELVVRRLLILLRRLAVREGTAYVFEANDQRLRRRIQRRFETLLSGLFVRGAFAGATETEAFRVVTDEGPEQAANIERGRLVVDLRVAPASPLAFITVRLVQTGGDMLAAGEL